MFRVLRLVAFFLYPGSLSSLVFGLRVLRRLLPVSEEVGLVMVLLLFRFLLGVLLVVLYLFHRRCRYLSLWVLNREMFVNPHPFCQREGVSR